MKAVFAAILFTTALVLPQSKACADRVNLKLAGYEASLTRIDAALDRCMKTSMGRAMMTCQQTAYTDMKAVHDAVFTELLGFIKDDPDYEMALQKEATAWEALSDESERNTGQTIVVSPQAVIASNSLGLDLMRNRIAMLLRLLSEKLQK